MKKTFFLLVFLWIFIGASMAQDIYTSGYFINMEGQKTAAIFKNDIIINKRAEEGRDLYSPAMVIDTLTDDIYWAINSNPVNDIANGYGRLLKNNEVMLNNGLGTHINATGQLVMTFTADSSNEINISGLPAGLYMIHCGNHTLRFIKEL